MPITKSEPPAHEGGGTPPATEAPEPQHSISAGNILVDLTPEPQPKAPEGEARTCLYCRHAVTPCGCHKIGPGDTTCDPPFKGHIHLDTGSHLCGFPLPGSQMGTSAEPDQAHGNCLAPDEGHHAIDCPSHPRYQP